MGRLTSAVGTGTAVYDYTYGAGGNLATRVNRTPNPDQTRTYTYGTPGNHHAHAVESISGSMTASYTYDANGNMATRTEILGTYTQTFDVENRLTSVIFGGQTTSFYYDADGNRILTVLPNGTKVYTPFPEYEKTVPTSGASTERSSYYLAGQLIAVWVKVGAGAGTLYYAFADRLGNVSAWTSPSGTLETNSLARYDPYGNYRTEPGTNANPGISDRGFTGHRMNNTGTYDLGLIYMNARYYLPEVGRFISADTIVPEPSNPQSYNRYSYTQNDPVNLIDPTGHKECGDDSGCLDTMPHSTPFQDSLFLAWIYFQSFDLPFAGEPSWSQEFVPGSMTKGGHDGVDQPGTFDVLAPGNGIVLRAGKTSAAGMWRIQNKETGEIKEWSIYPNNPGYQGKLTTSDIGEDGLYAPERFLASGEWVDIATDWSHERGTEIRIQHERGLETVYYHTTPSVSEKLQVSQGDTIGTTANTGYSTGTHLHYTVEFVYGNTGIALNPLDTPPQIAHLLR